MTYVEKAREIVGNLERLTVKHVAQLDALQNGQLPNPPVAVVNGVAVALSQLSPNVVVELLAATHKHVVSENIQHWQELQQLVAEVLHHLRAVDDPQPVAVAAPVQQYVPQYVQQPVQQPVQQSVPQQPQHTLLDFVQRMQQEPAYRTEPV